MDAVTNEDITFVCCIEAGRLEAQTVTMVNSLRAFGGDLSRSRIIAVIGRSGPGLSAGTVKSLDLADVELHRFRSWGEISGSAFAWFNYSNKIRAVALAQRLATTSQIAWLDSDILVAGDPGGLLLADDEDFAARTEPLNASVTASDRRDEPYWRKLAAVLDVSYEEIPWIEEGGRSRLAYFNSGVFVWRRSSTFASLYTDAFYRLMRSRLARADGSFFTADQVILSPVLAKGGLRWRHLALQSHRMGFPGLLRSDPVSWADSRILHYSGSLYAPFRDDFMARLAREMPTLAAWLRGQRSSDADASSRSSLHGAVLKAYRQLRWRLYSRRVDRALPSS